MADGVARRSYPERCLAERQVAKAEAATKPEATETSKALAMYVVSDRCVGRQWRRRTYKASKTQQTADRPSKDAADREERAKAQTTTEES